MDLITPKEAAGMLRVTRGTIYKLIARGELRAFKIPRMIDRPITRCSSQHYRLDRADVIALTEKNPAGIVI